MPLLFVLVINAAAFAVGVATLRSRGAAELEACRRYARLLFVLSLPFAVVGVILLIERFGESWWPLLVSICVMPIASFVLAEVKARKSRR